MNSWMCVLFCFYLISVQLGEMVPLLQYILINILSTLWETIHSTSLLEYHFVSRSVHLFYRLILCYKVGKINSSSCEYLPLLYHCTLSCTVIDETSWPSVTAAHHNRMSLVAQQMNPVLFSGFSVSTFIILLIPAVPLLLICNTQWSRKFFTCSHLAMLSHILSFPFRLTTLILITT